MVLNNWDLSYIIVAMLVSGFYLGVVAHKIFGKK